MRHDGRALGFHAAWRPGLLGFEIINDPGNSTTAGAGVEWAFADNWTAKVEYLYVNLGNGTVNCATEACLAVAGAPIPVSVGLTGNLVRAGVNFKFSF